jgi:hypothetical protein
MSGDHDDPLIARLWRDISSEAPAPLLDARIMRAARLQQRRQRLMPLAAALAACLMLTLYAVQFQPTPSQQAKLPDTSTFGLDEGRAGVPRAASHAAQQMMIRQMPGGSAYAEVVYP